MMVDGYTPLQLADEFSVRELYSVHYFEYASDYVYPGEAHDFWELCYVDKGAVEVQEGEQTIELKKPQMIFHKPGVFHALKANGKVAPNLVVVGFGCDSPAMGWFEGRIVEVGDEQRTLLARIIDEASGAFLSPLDDPELKSLTRSASAPVGAEQRIRLCLEDLLIGLARKGQQPEGEAKKQKPTSLIRERSQQDAIDKVVAYLEENVGKRLTLADICRDNIVGRSYLQKIFREKTGGGAMEYFGKLKIEAAKRMIREGKRNFTEISLALGYNSIHYFSRHFKKVTGMTPSEYASSVKVLTGRDRMV